MYLLSSYGILELQQWEGQPALYTREAYLVVGDGKSY